MDPEQLQVPLLVAREDEHNEDTQESVPSSSGRANLGIPGGINNLVKCVLGAGLLSIPRAFSLLGAGLATVCMAFVSTWTALTICQGLVTASTHQVTGGLFLSTYAELVYYWTNARLEWWLSFLMALGSLGFCTSYLDIIADILLGSGKNPGIISGAVQHLCGCNVFADGGGALALAEEGALGSQPWSWLLDRRIILAFIVVCILLPLCMRRSMASLGTVAAVGLFSLAAFMATLMWLAGAALQQGVAYPLRWQPDIDALGGWGARGALNTFGVLSILLTANGCHQNMHPLMDIVHPFTTRRIKTIVISTMAITGFYYWFVGLCSWVVFGPSIEDDILTNLSVTVMQPLIGERPAAVASYTVRLGYLASIVGSAVLTMFPLRTALADLIIPMLPPSRQYTPERIFTPLTLGVLAFSYVSAVAVPSIWVVISLVGSVSATGVGFMFPSLMIWQSTKQRGWRMFAGFTLVMGILIFLDGFATLYLKMRTQADGTTEEHTNTLGVGHALMSRLFLPSN